MFVLIYLLISKSEFWLAIKIFKLRFNCIKVLVFEKKTHTSSVPKL